MCDKKDMLNLTYRQSRPVPDGFALKQCRVVKRVSGWYVMLVVQCDAQVPKPLPHGEPLGIDLGLNRFVATSTGENISNCRKDYHFKVAHYLCDQAGMIFAEDLNLKALAAGMLCKHTLDGWVGTILANTRVCLLETRSLFCQS